MRPNAVSLAIVLGRSSALLAGVALLWPVVFMHLVSGPKPVADCVGAYAVGMAAATAVALGARGLAAGVAGLWIVLAVLEAMGIAFALFDGDYFAVSAGCISVGLLAIAYVGARLADHDWAGTRRVAWVLMAAVVGQAVWVGLVHDGAWELAVLGVVAVIVTIGEWRKRPAPRLSASRAG